MTSYLLAPIRAVATPASGATSTRKPVRSDGHAEDARKTEFWQPATGNWQRHYCCCSSVCSLNTITRGIFGGAQVPFSSFSSNQTSAVPLERLMVSCTSTDPKNQALPSDPHCP